MHSVSNMCGQAAVSVPRATEWETARSETGIFIVLYLAYVQYLVVRRLVEQQ